MTAPRPEPSSRSDRAFSVLMPVWAGDRPDRFRAALSSATLEQELPPDQLVMTVDGPVPAELEQVIDEVEAERYGPAQVLRSERHRGLAANLQDGLLAAPTDIIARADADDLCRPERFRLQIDAFVEQGLDLLGGAMQEFSDQVPPGTGPLRSRPLRHEEILVYLRRHSPFHHPTMVLRRETALAAGGYRDLRLLEDYWLWERMVLAGARTANLPDVVVDYRVDTDLFARRGGWSLLRSDIVLQRTFLRDHVITPRRFVLNLAERAGYRLAPGWLRQWGYRRLVERRTRAS